MPKYSMLERLDLEEIKWFFWFYSISILWVCDVYHAIKTYQDGVTSFLLSNYSRKHFPPWFLPPMPFFLPTPLKFFSIINYLSVVCIFKYLKITINWPFHISFLHTNLMPGLFQYILNWHFSININPKMINLKHKPVTRFPGDKNSP